MNSRIVGALWERSKDGKTYYSGVLKDLHGDINIAVFPNTYKERDNQPDFNIVLSFGIDERKQVVEPTKSVVIIKKNGKKKADEIVKSMEEEACVPF